MENETICYEGNIIKEKFGKIGGRVAEMSKGYKGSGYLWLEAKENQVDNFFT